MNFINYFPTITPLYALYNTLISARGEYHEENQSAHSLIMPCLSIMKEEYHYLSRVTMDAGGHRRPAVPTASAEIHTTVIQRSRW